MPPGAGLSGGVTVPGVVTVPARPEVTNPQPKTTPAEMNHPVTPSRNRLIGIPFTWRMPAPNLVCWSRRE